MDSPCMSQHCSLATEMPFQDASCIIDLSINHNPAITFFIVFLNLFLCELLLRCSRVLFGFRNQELCRWLQPAVFTSTGLSWMTEENFRYATVRLFNYFGPDDIPAVVHHSIPVMLMRLLGKMTDKQRYLPHGVPAGPLGLRVLEDIETLYSDAFCLEQVCSFHIHMPMQPCPKFVTVSDGSLWKLFNIVLFSTISFLGIHLMF